ncbi:MAG: HRDC domain-containing protein [Verrucomicrobiota bacterium]
MPYAFFQISASGETSEVAEMNRFLASHRVVAIHREWIDAAPGEKPAWAFCIDYLDGANAGPDGGKTHRSKSSRVDYKEVLPPDQFAVFARLRDLRKHIAEESGLPVFSVFTNEQLAEMVRSQCRTKADLGKIAGIGESRLKQYGERFLAELRGTTPEKESE